MDYEQRFRDVIAGLKAEGRYRVFADLERLAGRFPRALRHRPAAEGGGKVVIADLQAEPGEKLAKELGGRFLKTDVTSEADGKAVVALALKEFGTATRRVLRVTDLIGRLGGEEFAVVLPGSSAGTAFVVAERIRIAFAEACRTLDDKVLNATVSAGVTTAVPISTLDTLIAAADRALYRAKADGRNRVEMAERRPPVKEPAMVSRAVRAAARASRPTVTAARARTASARRSGRAGRSPPPPGCSGRRGRSRAVPRCAGNG